MAPSLDQAHLILSDIKAFSATEFLQEILDSAKELPHLVLDCEAYFNKGIADRHSRLDQASNKVPLAPSHTRATWITEFDRRKAECEDLVKQYKSLTKDAEAKSADLVSYLEQRTSTQATGSNVIARAQRLARILELVTTIDRFKQVNVAIAGLSPPTRRAYEALRDERWMPTLLDWASEGYEPGAVTGLPEYWAEFGRKNGIFRNISSVLVPSIFDG